MSVAAGQADPLLDAASENRGPCGMGCAHRRRCLDGADVGELAIHAPFQLANAIDQARAALVALPVLRQGRTGNGVRAARIPPAAREAGVLRGRNVPRIPRGLAWDR